MSTRADQQRRKWGMFCLSSAVGMLVFGQTLLESRLQGVSYLIYWIICFLFTMAAIAIALLDVSALRKQSQSVQKEILKDTFGDLESDLAEEDSGLLFLTLKTVVDALDEAMSS